MQRSTGRQKTVGLIFSSEWMKDMHIDKIGESLKLTPRLYAIAARIPPGAKLADIGTDHGHLPLYLLKIGHLQRAIASDLRPGPLNHARRNAFDYGLSDRISFRLASGLDAISPDECDVISIAGMGGETIIEILQAAPWTADGKHILFLQPMTMLPQLRQWLWENGYHIDEEIVCQEGYRYYLVWSVIGGAQRIKKTLADCYLSLALMRDTQAKAYLKTLYIREKRVLDGMQQGKEIKKAVIDLQIEVVTKIRKALEELKCQQ